MAKKQQGAKLPKIERMLAAFKAAWLCTDRSNPWSAKVDDALVKANLRYTTFDLKTQAAIIAGKQKRTAAEQKFLSFVAYTMHYKEQQLVDKVSTALPGQIFLLKTQHGYKEGSELTITERKEVVTEYGQD